MQVCKRCLYDENIPMISFDADGLCNYCNQYDDMCAQYPTGKEGMSILEAEIVKIKKDQKNSKYDVVIGVSGGCDSSYMIHMAHKMGLRILAAHFDNTFNSKIAVENIKNVLDPLGIDLYTHVVDNQEYQRIFKSMLLAGVPECDAPTDLALAVTHYMAASKHKVKYIWEGHSFRTEGITPPGWVYMDAKYVSSIHKRFGDGKIKTLPMFWLKKWLKWMVIDGIKKFRPLYYLDYDKEEAKKMLAETYGWQWYGGHHMENRSAFFADNYWALLHDIDLRSCEFSALIRSGQMSKEVAEVEIKKPKRMDQDVMEEVKNRLGFSDSEWDDMINAPKKHYTAYPTYKRTFEKLRPLFYILYKKGYVTRSFYSKFCFPQSFNN
jgi:hypothetical protein